MSEKSKNKIYIVILLALLAVFLMMGIYFNELKYIDVFSNNFVNNIRNEYLNNIFIFITNTGNFTPMTIFSVFIVLLFLFKRKYKESIVYIFNIITAIGLNQLLKHLVKRERPLGYRFVEAAGYSFPSGHSMVSMAVCILMIYFIFKFIKNKLWNYTLSAVLLIYTILIGISRIYVRVHFATDVLVAWILGTLIALLSIIIYDKFNK